MNILRTVTFHLRIIGCLPIELPASVPVWCKKVPINQIRIGLGGILLVHNLISTVWFWQYETQTHIDRQRSGFFALRAAICLMLYVQLIRHRHRLAEQITSLEEMIAKSKINLCLLLLLLYYFI